MSPLALGNRLSLLCFDFYSDPREYLQHVMKATNMSCLTPEGAVSGDCDFLSANMYARSLFGELCSKVPAKFGNLTLCRRGCFSESECGED